MDFVGWFDGPAECLHKSYVSILFRRGYLDLLSSYMFIMDFTEKSVVLKLSKLIVLLMISSMELFIS